MSSVHHATKHSNDLKSGDMVRSAMVKQMSTTATIVDIMAIVSMRSQNIKLKSLSMVRNSTLCTSVTFVIKKHKKGAFVIRKEAERPR